MESTLKYNENTKGKFFQVVKTLFKSIRQYKKQTFLTMLFVGFETIIECVIPLIMGYLVNTINGSSPFEMSFLGDPVTNMMYYILFYAAILLVLATLSLICGILSGIFCSYASIGFTRNLRQDLYNKINSFSFKNIDKFSISSLVTRQTTDIMNIQLAYYLSIRISVRSVLMLIFSIVMAFIASPSIAWVFLILVPLLFGILFFITMKVDPIYRRGFRKYDALNESIQENIKGIRTVKTYVKEEYEKEKFSKNALSLQSTLMKADRIVALTSPLMQFFMYTSMCTLLGFGTYLIVTSAGASLDIGKLSTLITYGAQCLSSIMMITMVLAMIIMALESMGRVYEVLIEKNAMLENNATLKDLDDGSIILKDVSFRYDETSDVYALTNINLNIKSGQTVGIIGETGSAKSTLINLLPRFFDASKGEVIVGGHNVKDYDIRSLRNQIGVVLQKNVLFSGTIKDNLLWGNKDASDEEIKKACQVAQADEFVSSFKDGYNSKVEQGGTNLSGGQKQRLCIARAILKNPKILILDDSTSAVDTKTDAFIREGLKEVCPTTTKLIIAQRISSVQDCDFIVVLKNGTINGIGSHDELLKNNEIYRDIYNIQNKIGGEQK